MYGTFKRFKNTKCIVKFIDVTEEQYQKIKDMVHQFEKEKKAYRFNVVGLFAVAFHKKIQRANSYYCAEFVKYVLEEADVTEDLPNLIKPDDFNKLDNTTEVYKGLLRKYAVKAT